MTQQISDDTKTQLLTVRMAEDKYFEFKAVAAARGLSMSALVTQFAFQVIREAKRDMPTEFEEKLAEVMAERRASLAQELSVIDTPLDELISESSVHESHKHAPHAPTQKEVKK